MKTKSLIIVVLGMFLLAGCAGNSHIAKPVTDLMAAENQFVLDVLEYSNPTVMAAEMAFFRALLGPRIVNFKCCIKEGFDAIDDILLDDAGLVNGRITEMDIMEVHGIRWLMLSEGLEEMIEQYAPDVLRYLPAFFLFP